MAAPLSIEQLVHPTWVFATFVVSILVAGVAAAYRIMKLGGRIKKVEGAVSSIDKNAGSEEGSDDEDDKDVDQESEDEFESAEKIPKIPKDNQKLLKTVDKNLAEKKSKKKKKGKNVMDDDWEWPVYDEWFSRLTYRKERKLRAPEKDGVKKAPFEVIYEQQQGWPDEVFVTLFSKHLIQAASKFLPDNKQLFLEKPKIDAQLLFVALDSVRSFQFGEDEKVARCHLKHFVRFLETEYKDTIVHVDRMGRDRTSTWDLLWAFLYKGQKVCYTCSYTGQRLLGIVDSTWYRESAQGKLLFVTLEVRDYNGSRYQRCYIKRHIKQFKGEKSFNSLDVCPMRFVNQREQLEDLFLANGEKFYEYATKRHGFMQFRGPRLKLQLVGGCYQLKKRKADGRVMVDLLSFARMNPEYPLDNAEPPCCQGDVMCAMEENEVPSDEDLMLAPAVVFGFSFAIKEWGCFDINGLSDIHFDDQAFDRDLVLTNALQKQMLLGLVSQYLQDPRDDESGGVAQIDPISSKGEGCIFLCYGPPGTGKTLTAESVAEKLHRPLWSVSVFELGTKANDVEKSLLDILDIASQWRAVLLLDEADIYLEKRTSNGDPNRSAMTAIFLRLLEYYSGVLFLTTNRVSSFDDAFCSRISMFLRYHRLGNIQREKVWGNFLGRAGLKDVDLQQFANFQLNGREIRNTIRIAQTWAKSSKVELTDEHVLQVVHMLAGFRGDLEGAITEEADEQEISIALAKVNSMKGRHGAAENGLIAGMEAGEEDEDTMQCSNTQVNSHV